MAIRMMHKTETEEMPVKTKKALQTVWITLAAWLMSVAPGLSMAVQRKLKPDAYDLGGMLYQLVGRTFNALTTDPFTLTVLFCVFFFLARRYLFHKPAKTGAGEYVLCGVMSAVMLVCAAMRTGGGTVKVLYENTFQIMKTALYLPGMFLIELCLLRGLNELLHRPWKERPIRLWDRHPFVFPMVIIALAWLPHVIIKYPGVIHLDVVMPIRQYIGLSPRMTDFPVLGTLFYGVMFELGQALGNVNITYFAITLVQLFSLLMGLCYALWLMKTKGGLQAVQILSLVLFCTVPIYIGWALIIGKDAQYMAWMILLGDMLIEFFAEPFAFVKRKSRWVLLSVIFVLLIFTRGNGVFIVIPMAAVMALWLLVKGRRGSALGMAAVAAAAMMVTSTTNAIIVDALDMQDIRFYDYLSIPFQQTARVAKLHGDEGLTEQDKTDICTMIDYNVIAERYEPHHADAVKMSVDRSVRGQHTPWAYLRVWWKQLWQYPLDYLDAFANMNYYMFDLQSNRTVYNSYADIKEYTYNYAFHETFFFNQEEIRPLLHWQLALTEAYFRFDDLPVIGQFASMGFCIHVMLGVAYLAWTQRKRRALLVMIPSFISAVMTMFCPEIYIRYLLPVMGALPLWLAAYDLLPDAGETLLAE